MVWECRSVVWECWSVGVRVWKCGSGGAHPRQVCNYENITQQIDSALLQVVPWCSPLVQIQWDPKTRDRLHISIKISLFLLNLHLVKVTQDKYPSRSCSLTQHISVYLCNIINVLVFYQFVSDNSSIKCIPCHVGTPPRPWTLSPSL